MTKYSGSSNQVDIENILDRVIEYYSNNFNGILTEIDTWKNDGITLEPVNANAFYVGLEKDMPNYDPFMTFDIMIDSVESNRGQAHAKELMIPIVLYKADTNDGNLWRHSFRYQKAMYVCLERYRDIPNASGIMGITHLEVKNIDRFYLSDRDGSTIEREAIGIMLTGSLC